MYTDNSNVTKWQRPGLDDAPAHMLPNDMLVVPRLDGLGRSLDETVNTIADLAGRDIKVKAFERELDTSRSGDKVVINFMASPAERERDLLIQRCPSTGQSRGAQAETEHQTRRGCERTCRWRRVHWFRGLQIKDVEANDLPCASSP